MDTIKLLTEFGQAGAILVAVVLFLRHLKGRDDKHDQMVENHLSRTYDQHQGITAALEKMTQTLGALRDVILLSAGKGRKE